MATDYAEASALPAASGTLRHQYVAFALMVAFFVLAPFVVYPLFLMKALCFALFACAFNLLIGYAGLLSFGHAAFLGSAGYVTAHAAKVWGWPPELAILGGTAAAGALGLVVGGLAIRRQGIYFAMVTLALAQMIYFFCLQAPFTHGEDGIQAVPRGTLLGLFDLRQTMTLYFVVLAIFLGGFLLIYRTIYSPFGQVLKAIRENEPRAISLGYKADQYKLIAFVLSADAVGAGGRHQGDRLPARLAHRRALDHVGRGRADDAARRARHRLRAGGRRVRGHRARELPGPARCLGDRGAGRDLRRLRAHVPPRARRRARAHAEEASLAAA